MQKLLQFVVAVVMVVLLLGLPAFLAVVGAQDVALATNTPTGGMGMDSDFGTVSEAPSRTEVAINLITLIAGIGVGVVAGGGSVLVVVSRLRNDVVLLTAMERLASSWPPGTRELLNNLAGVLNEVTDDVPVMQKPAPAVVDGSNAGGK